METSCIHRYSFAHLTIKSPLKFAVISCRFNIRASHRRPGRKVVPKLVLALPKIGFLVLCRTDKYTFTRSQINHISVWSSCQRCFPDAGNGHIWLFSQGPLICSPTTLTPHTIIQRPLPLLTSPSDSSSPSYRTGLQGRQMELSGPFRAWAVFWGLRLIFAFNGLYRRILPRRLVRTCTYYCSFELWRAGQARMTRALLNKC